MKKKSVKKKPVVNVCWICNEKLAARILPAREHPICVERLDDYRNDCMEAAEIVMNYLTVSDFMRDKMSLNVVLDILTDAAIMEVEARSDLTLEKIGLSEEKLYELLRKDIKRNFFRS